jgi:FixJ family two-component response regulator
VSAKVAQHECSNSEAGRAQQQRSAVIVIAEHWHVPMAVSAMKSGALHFIEKVVHPDDAQSVRRAV